MDSSPDTAEKMHQIYGTGRSFSSKADDLDEKAAEVFEEIRQKGIDGLEVLGDAFGMDPQHLPKGFFLSRGLSYWNNLVLNLLKEQNNIWRRSHGSAFGYGIGHYAYGYQCFKRTYVYHKGNHKTNWIMVVYSLINENSYIKSDDVVLCHVIQSDNYDPRPNPFSKSVPKLFDFDKREVDSRMLRLEDLMNNPESFKEMDSSPDVAEEVHQILGTGISFSSKPHDLDVNAAKELREIQKKGIHGLEVHADAFEMEPQNLPKGFFLSNVLSCWENLVTDAHNKQNVIWRSHGSVFGYGVGHHASGYDCLKRSYVYHKGNINHKTNLIMVVYSLVHKNSYIKAYDVELCHVFQSDNYDPKPPKLVPNVFDSDQTSLNSCVEELEYLMENPKAFDFDYFNGRYSRCDSKLKANGRNGKRSNVWKHFTEIKVLGPVGEVMLTLAICHGCSMAYLTGKWDSKKGSLSNNGTKTLKEHYRRCSDQHHITGNPQGAHHQMP